MAHDIIILGAGHNGLVTAFYLARAGFRPLLLERREQVGGAAVTGEFHPGFRCSTLAHSAGPLRPAIVRDMELEKHGLKMVSPDLRLLPRAARCFFMATGLSRRSPSPVFPPKMRRTMVNSSARWARFPACSSGCWPWRRLILTVLLPPTCGR